MYSKVIGRQYHAQSPSAKFLEFTRNGEERACEGVPDLVDAGPRRRGARFSRWVASQASRHNSGGSGLAAVDSTMKMKEPEKLNPPALPG